MSVLMTPDFKNLYLINERLFFVICFYEDDDFELMKNVSTKQSKENQRFLIFPSQKKFRSRP